MIELLKRHAVDVTFRPDAGSFRSKLTEMVIANADEESTELFSAHNCDIQVSFTSHTIDEGLLRFLVISDLGEQTLECVLSDLNHSELIDLEEQLSRHISLYPSRTTQDEPKMIVQKNINGMFNTHQAAQKIGCSHVFLKSKIPCSEYTYVEVDGKKEIKEYFWSIKLIDRICHIKLNGTNQDDVKYIAEECCDGDCKWADDILSSLGCPVPTRKTDGTEEHGITKRSSKIISKGIGKQWPSRKKHP